MKVRGIALGLQGDFGAHGDPLAAAQSGALLPALANGERHLVGRAPFVRSAAERAAKKQEELGIDIDGLSDVALHLGEGLLEERPGLTRDLEVQQN